MDFKLDFFIRSGSTWSKYQNTDLDQYSLLIHIRPLGSDLLYQKQLSLLHKDFKLLETNLLTGQFKVITTRWHNSIWSKKHSRPSLYVLLKVGRKFYKVFTEPHIEMPKDVRFIGDQDANVFSHFFNESSGLS